MRKLLKMCVWILCFSLLVPDFTMLVLAIGTVSTEMPSETPDEMVISDPTPEIEVQATISPSVLEIEVPSETPNISNTSSPTLVPKEESENEELIPITTPEIVSADNENTYTYSYTVLEDGTAEITGVSRDGWNNEDLVIPDEIDGYTVSSIGKQAFYLLSATVNPTGKLILPKNLKKIGQQAFSGINLTGELKLPEGLEEIEWAAFSRCDGFTGELVLPDTVKKVGQAAFMDCSGFIGELILPENILEIGDSAFRGCEKFEGTLILPSSLTYVGDSAFQACTGITGVVWPSSLDRIGDYTFCCCSGIESLVLPEGLKSTGENVFESCISLKRVKLPDGFISLGEYAFGACTNLSDVFLPNSLQEIVWNAFSSQLGQKLLDVTLYCYEGSYALRWAKDKGYRIVQRNANSSDIQYIDGMISISANDLQCVVFVYDVNTKAAVSEAVVSIADSKYEISNDGIVAFSASDSEVSMEIQVEAEGYVPVETVQKIRNGTVVRIGMSANSDSLLVSSVIGEIDGKKYDLVRNKLVLGYVSDMSAITDLISQSFKINVKTNKIVSKYEIIERIKKGNETQETVVMTSDFGEFLIPISTGGKTSHNDTISTSMPVLSCFKPEGQYFIRVTRDNGDSALEPIGISTTVNYLTEERKYQSGTVKIGETIEVRIPDDIPFVGGGKLNFGLMDDCPIEIYADEDGVIKVTLNKPLDTPVEKYGKDFKRLKDKAKTASALSKKMGASVQSFGAGYFKVDGSICGYGEGNISELNQGKVCITLEVIGEIEGTGGYKQYFFPSGIPVNLFVDGNVKGNVGVKGKIDIRDWKITKVDISGGAINVNVGLTAGAGVGIGLEINASVTGNVNYECKPARDYQKVWLEASGKIAAIAGPFEKDLWNSSEYKYTIFQKGIDELVSTDQICEMMSEFHPLSRNYLDYSQGYNNSLDAPNFVNGNKTDKKDSIIKKAVFPGANPKMIRTDDAVYVFWVEDIISRNANNRTALVYVRSTDGFTWSVPCRVLSEEEDNTLDGDYNISKYDKYIVITWQDADHPIEESDDLLAVAKNFNVRKAIIDTSTDKIIEDTILTSEKGYYMYPSTELINGDSYTVYVANGLETNDISGNNIHTLHYIKNDEPQQSIILPLDYKVVNMETGVFDEKVFAVCELDLDGDNLTYDDHEIYAFDLSTGISIQLTNNEICDTMPVISDVGNIYWYQEGNIICSKGMNGEISAIWEQPQLQNCVVLSTVTDERGKDTLIWESTDLQKDNGSVAMYHVSQNADGIWGNATVFTRCNGTIASKTSGVAKDGTIIVAHLEGTFLTDGSMLKDLCVVEREEYEDISVDYVNYEEKSVVPNEELPLQVGITNKGNTIIKNVDVEINGNTGYTVSNLYLQQGDSTEITISGFIVPDDIQESQVNTVQIHASKEDKGTDNIVEIIIGCPDLSVEAGTRFEDGHAWLDFWVVNDSIYPTDGNVRVHVNTEDGEIIEEKAFTGLEKNNSFAWTISLEEYEALSTRYYVEAIADKTENLTGDNIAFVYTGYGTGIEFDEAEDIDNITKLILNHSTCNMRVGETISLEVTSDAGEVVDFSDLILSSSNKTVANIDGNGIITAYRAGAAHITAYYGDLSVECQVTVADSKDKRFTVQFDSQGGTRIGSITDIIPGSVITLPKGVEKDNCAFLGWFTLPEGGEKVSSPSNIFTVEKSMTLYAQWASSEEVPKGLWIQEVSGQVYTGKAIEPAVVIYDGVALLIDKTDYTITYKNNKNAYTYTDEDYAAFEENLQATGKRVKTGTFDPAKAPQVTIRMKGNYSGSQTIYFKIEPADITGEEFAAGDLAVTWNGKKQTPAPTLTWNGRKLKYGTDFHIPEYDKAKNDKSAFTAQGTYNLTITGKGNFAGEIPVTLTISEGAKQIAMDKVTVKGIKNLSWTGGQLMQTGFTAGYKNDVLSEENGDYTVSWGTNTDVGTGTLTLTGTGLDQDGDGYSYIGTKTVSFKITGTSMSRVTVEGLKKEYAYTGDAIRPETTLTYKADKNAAPVPLEEGTHYAVAYEKNTEKGTAAIIFTGLAGGGYTGTKKVTFRIVSSGIADKKEEETLIEQVSVTFKDTENLQNGIYTAPYMKGGAKPEIIVTSGEKTLIPGKDYTVSYANNKKTALSTDAKAPSLTVKGRGNYTGSKTVYFSIEAKPLSNENGITIAVKDKVESTKKNGYRQSFKVYDADGTALGGSDYDSGNVIYTLIQTENADGTVSTVNEVLDKDSVVPANSVISITVQGKGVYAGGTATETYRILENSHDISKATIQISDQSYTGKPVLITEQSQFKTGKVFIRIGKETKVLTLGEDIEVVPDSYVKNVNKGTAKVTFRGINDFGGTKTVSFRIGTRSIGEFWKGIFTKVTKMFG